MKALLSFFTVLFVSANIFAQTTLDFDTYGQDLNWVVFDQADTNSLTFVTNPDLTGINTSATCAQFISEAGVVPWAGVKTSDFDITVSNAMECIQVMVYKDALTNFGVKLEDGTLAACEVKVMPTVTNQWELLTFDYASVKGGVYGTLVFFPDFPDDNPRVTGHTVLFDNVTFIDSATCHPTPIGIIESSNVSLNVFPNPASDYLLVSGGIITEIELFNILGENVYEMKSINTNQYTINLDGIKKGVYFLVVGSNDYKVTKKVVIE